jgi:hypothetical protein
MKKTDSLDMKPTLDFYESNKELLASRLPSESQSPLEFVVRRAGIMGLSKPEIQGITESFPKYSLERMIPFSIFGMPQTWFAKERDKNGNPKPTRNADEKISETAIIPSYIHYGPWRKTGNPGAVIWLYDLPDKISPETRKIVLTEGLVHEMGHALIIPALYFSENNLVLPNGKTVPAKEFVEGFVPISEGHGPISHYSSTYWKGRKLNNVNEELAESIAARLLGFAFCKDENRGLNPFSDRPEVASFVDDFLNAKKESK